MTPSSFQFMSSSPFQFDDVTTISIYDVTTISIYDVTAISIYMNRSISSAKALVTKLTSTLLRGVGISNEQWREATQTQVRRGERGGGGGEREREKDGRRWPAISY
jgi:hypothetical protein